MRGAALVPVTPPRPVKRMVKSDSRVNGATLCANDCIRERHSEEPTRLELEDPAKRTLFWAFDSDSWPLSVLTATQFFGLTPSLIARLRRLLPAPPTPTIDICNPREGSCDVTSSTDNCISSEVHRRRYICNLVKRSTVEIRNRTFLDTNL